MRFQVPGSVVVLAALLLAGAITASAQRESAAPESKLAAPPDMVGSGLFTGSDEAVQGRTVRGQSILDAPPFQVLARKELLENYPCSDCHEDEPVNRKERRLTEEHEDIVLKHGAGRFWCLTCHGSRSKDALTSLKGKPIDFDQAFVLCGQCHFQRQKDWYFGGHGKRAGAWPEPHMIPLTHDKLRVADRSRIGQWRGARVLLSCPTCHNPHSPAIKPFKASPPPRLRAGLSPAERVHEGHQPIWVRLRQEQEKEQRR